MSSTVSYNVRLKKIKLNVYQKLCTVLKLGWVGLVNIRLDKVRFLMAVMSCLLQKYKFEIALECAV
jgi:hypothetical protein